MQTHIGAVDSCISDGGTLGYTRDIKTDNSKRERGGECKRESVCVNDWRK